MTPPPLSFSCICRALLLALGLAAPTRAIDLRLASAWGAYTTALAKKPLLTKSLTACGTNALGDAICQRLAKKGPGGAGSGEETASFDGERLSHAAVTGLVWSGPSAHVWYGLLFGTLTSSIKDPVAGLAARLAIDAAIFSPVAVSGYFTLRSFLEGTGLPGARDKLRSALFPTVKGAWKFWPAANVVNFSVVPAPLRVLYMNVMSVFWSGYLAYANSRSLAAEG
ncbi:hypothetical protein ACHAWF_011855 [Thalassiosira exigua]